MSRTGSGGQAVWGLLFVSLAVSAAGPFLAGTSKPPAEITPVVYSESEGRFVWRKPGSASDGTVETGEGAAGTQVGGAKGLLFGRKLDLDAATFEDLDSLPGVGPATARAIIKKRDESGGFGSSGDLERVNGLGPKKAGFLKNWISTGRSQGMKHYGSDTF